MQLLFDFKRCTVMYYDFHSRSGNLAVRYNHRILQNKILQRNFKINSRTTSNMMYFFLCIQIPGSTGMYICPYLNNKGKMTTIKITVFDLELIELEENLQGLCFILKANMQE